MTLQARCNAVAAAALLALLPFTVSAQNAQAQADGLTEVMLQMLPFGKILDDAAAADPEWPLQGKADKVTPKQLGCLRSELSTTGYRRSKRAEALTYVQAHPERIDADMALLKGGAASVFSDFINAGVDEAQTGKKVETSEVMKKMKADQMLSFVDFITDADNAPLRELVGIGEAFNPSKTAQENSDAGKSIGTRLVLKLMLGAMTTCDVPPSTILE
ncbi:hypothetical protein V1318_02640 [Lysobacter sp. CCNWLW3]|uniref:hypothetical protein n=1 Tax=unclassified Lysobacter TaxID=2635362 RepID=UPI002FD7431C